jgi:hypothetical protein
MSEAPFQTLEELAKESPRLKRERKLHPLVQARLAALLQDIWPDAYAKPEPGEMPAGRSDLGFYFAHGRYAVFEIFATVSQVPQDLRHLEQSDAHARIAILPDPLLDNGVIYDEYYAKRPRNPFPALKLGEILVAENEAAGRQKLKECIQAAFATREPVVASAEGLASRLAELSLDDESSATFGENRFTVGVEWLDGRCVLIAALPSEPVSYSTTNVLKAARSMLDTENWYHTTGDGFPPRCWPERIFEVPRSRHSDQNAVLWENPLHGSTTVTCRLAVTGNGEVFFASSEGADFVTRLPDGTGVFKLARILAECWKLSGLVARLYHDIGHEGKAHLCVAMIRTAGTHLGGFAPGYAEPSEPYYWSWAGSPDYDWACHSANLKYCQTVDVMTMEAKRQPQFPTDFADVISLAYNHDTPRCFDKKTGLIPRYYL